MTSSIKVKFDRREWTLTEKDLFFDNGKCITLITQEYFSKWWYYRPVLTKALATKWKKAGVLYTTENLKRQVASKYPNSPCCNYYKINLEKLKEVGFGVVINTEEKESAKE